jgi:hypothetical protein
VAPGVEWWSDENSIDRLQEMKPLGILAPVDEEWIGKSEARRAALE